MLDETARGAILMRAHLTDSAHSPRQNTTLPLMLLANMHSQHSRRTGLESAFVAEEHSLHRSNAIKAVPQVGSR
eukprot:3214929-Pyramimonas_sp.AAC.1